MSNAAQLAQTHWNVTPLLLTEQERYFEYPWLYEVAEFREREGHQVLEVGCGTGSDQRLLKPRPIPKEPQQL
jgi:hypothetical protein